MHLNLYLLDHQPYLCFELNYIYFGATISYTTSSAGYINKTNPIDQCYKWDDSNHKSRLVLEERLQTKRLRLGEL